MPDSHNKRIAKNTLFLYLRMALVMVIQLYTSRIILDSLGQDGYGIYSVVGGLVVILSFVNGAMISTTQRFLSFELGRKDFDRLRLTFSQSIYAHILIAIVFLIIAETVGLWFLNTKMVISPGFKTSAFWVFQFSVLSFIISLLQVPFGALITAHERMEVYAFIGIIEVLIKLGIAFSIGIFAYKNRLIWYALFIFIASLVVNLSYVIYCRMKYVETKLIFKVDRPIFKALTGFAGWSIVGTLAWLGKNQGINVVLNLFYGAAINAAYGIAMQINTAISSFVQSFMMSMNPQIVQSYAAQMYQRTNSLMIVGSKISFMLLFLVVFPISVVTNDILAIWLVEVPDYTSIFTKLVLGITLCESFTHVMGTAIQATGKIKVYQIIIGFTILLNLPIAYFLLKKGFPPYSVLICGILVSLVALLERILILEHQIIGFSAKKFFHRSILQSILVILSTLVIYRLISSSITDCGWVSRMVMALISVFISECFLGFSKSERHRVIQLLKKLKVRIWIQSKRSS